MMAFIILLSLSVLLCISKNASAVDSDDKIAMLIERIEKLESKDIENKREILHLNAKIQNMEAENRKKSSEFLNQIKELNEQLVELKYKSTTKESDVVAIDDDALEEKESSKGRRISTVRRAVETEIAFYATHTQHDVQHVGANSIIVFDSVVTNVGNAYDIGHGTFTAPVDGVYVFHVTMMGMNDPTDGHYRAHIDVNGVRYSELYVIPYDQSSHAFVKELRAGATVSIKNDHNGAGFIGQHFSSFSGFLLYQHF